MPRASETAAANKRFQGSSSAPIDQSLAWALVQEQEDHMRSLRDAIYSLGLALLILALSLPGMAAAQSTPETGGEPVPLRLAVSSWVGYGPLWLAEEKGFFDEEGVAVDLSLIEVSADRITAMQADRLDASATTVDTWTLFSAQGADLVQVLATDESSGGDGIVAKKEIASIADLAGKTVAVQSASTSQFLLANALKEAGLSLDDLNLLDMSSGDAGAAFVAGQVDAAVTWQPWLANARETDFGHLLLDTKETPGLIVDTVAFRPQYVAEHPEAVAAFARAFYRAIEEIAANPDEANAIMAESIGMDAADFEATLADLKLWGKDENVAYFGTAEEPGPIYDLTQQAGEFYEGIGVSDNVPDPQAIVDPSFVDGEAG
jgi:NitT/TauT family transport system substrate-binding protein